MKKVIFFMAFGILSFSQVMNAQICDAITAQVLPMSPQPSEENYDYYGVRVNTNISAGTEIYVQGYIHDEASISHGQPFQLTISPGNTEAQTASDFFQIERGTNVVITVTSVWPCPQSYELTPAALAADNDFVELTQLTFSSFEGFDSVIKNMPEENFENYSSQIQFYTSQSQLNEAQVTNLSNLMGFSSVSTFTNYVNTSTELVSRLKARYSAFQTTDVNELIGIVNSAYNILYPYIGSDLCEQIYRNCRAGAHATYSTEIIACTGTAIGVGAVTAGWGGVIFQIGCGATSFWHYTTMKRNCELEYKRCKT